MKKILYYSLWLCLSYFLSCNSVLAQRTYNYFSIGPSLGVAHYQGDLDNNAFDFWRVLNKDAKIGNPFLQMRPTFGFVANYHFHPYMYTRLTLNHGWLYGSDADSPDPNKQARNLSFSTTITEASLQLVYEFFAADYDFVYTHGFRLNWSPYVFAGVAFFHFNPKAQPDPSWLERYPDLFPNDKPVALRPLGTEGQYLDDPNNLYPDPYSLYQFAIPMGMGVRRKLSDRWDLRFEIGLRKTFTDYIDDVSGAVEGTFYASPTDFLNKGYERSFLFADRSTGPGSIGTNGYGEGLKRGDRHQDDWYGFSQFILTYIIDRADRCPSAPPGRKRRRF